MRLTMLAMALLTSVAAAQITIPAHNNVYNGYTRGFGFTAQTAFNIVGLDLPTNAFQAGDTAAYAVRVNGVTVHNSRLNAGAVAVSIPVVPNDIVDIVGNWSPAAAGTFTAHNSYGSATAGAGAAPFATTILGVPHTLNRVGVQNDIGSAAWVAGTGYLAPTTGQIGRVDVYVSGGSGTVLATNTSIGAGCVASYASIYENFATAAALDLSNTSWQFISTGGGYTIIPGGAFLPVGSVQAVPTVLGLGDDTAVTQPFTTGSYPGATALTVCSNGFVSTNTGNGTTFTPTIATMLSDPAASFRCWHDFNPSLVGSGTVKWEESASVTSITWDGVWDYGGTGVGDASTMQFQFYPNGDVVVAFGSMSLVGTSGTGFLVGYSPAGASADPGNTDWSALAVAVLGSADVLPLSLAATSRPIIGTSWGMTTSNVPGPTIVVEVVGLSDPGINDLFFLGMPGCGLRANLDLLNATVAAGPTHVWSFGIPNNVALLNLHLYTTSAAFAPVNAFGAISSNGIDGLMGDF